jgi:hypothetical protein
MQETQRRQSNLMEAKREKEVLDNVLKERAARE